MHEVSHNGRIYCGPAAIMAVTGLDLPTIRTAINKVRGRRHNAGVCGLSREHLCAALKELGVGYDVRTTHVPGSTLERVVQGMPADTTYIIEVTGHYVTVRNGVVTDNRIRFGTTVADHPSRRKHVRACIVVVRPARWHAARNATQECVA